MLLSSDEDFDPVLLRSNRPQQNEDTSTLMKRNDTSNMGETTGSSLAKLLLFGSVED